MKEISKRCVVSSLVMMLIIAKVGLSQEQQLQISPQLSHVVPTSVSAPTAETPNWLPKGKYPSIDSLSYARLGTDQKTIEIIQPVLNTETHTRPAYMPRCRTETQQRTVGVDGKALTLDYTVQVCDVVIVEAPYTAMQAASVRRIQFSIGKVRAWELSGKELSETELANRLQKPIQVFIEPVVESDLGEIKFQPQDPFSRSVLKPETIVI